MNKKQRQLGYLVLLTVLAASNIALGMEYVGVLLPNVLITNIPDHWVIVLDSHQSTIYVGDLAAYVATSALLVSLLLKQWDEITQ